MLNDDTAATKPSRHTTSPTTDSAAASPQATALAALSTIVLTAVLPAAVAIPALPDIAVTLGAGQAGHPWVLTALLVTAALSAPVWSQTRTRVASRALVQAALVVVAVASIAASLAPTAPVLLVAQAVQGIGAGGILALTPDLARRQAAAARRNRIHVLVGATVAGGVVVGLVLGGVLVDLASWRWGAALPVLPAGTALALLRLAPQPDRPDQVEGPATASTPEEIDLLGAGLLTGSVVSLLVWASLAGEKFGWWSLQTGLLVGAGVVLLALTVKVEERTPRPVVPLRLMHHPVAALASLTSLLVGAVTGGLVLALVQLFRIARVESPSVAAVMLLPLVAGLVLGAVGSQRAVARSGRWKAWLVTAAATLTATLVLLGTVRHDSSYLLETVFAMPAALAIGTVMRMLVVAVTHETPAQDQRQTLAFVAVAHVLGGALGIAALGGLLANRVAEHLADAQPDPASLPPLGSVPTMDQLSSVVRTSVQDSYGAAVAETLLATAPVALFACLLTLFVRYTDPAAVHDDHWDEETEPMPTHTPDGTAGTQPEDDRQMTRSEWLAQNRARGGSRSRHRARQRTGATASRELAAADAASPDATAPVQAPAEDPAAPDRPSAPAETVPTGPSSAETVPTEPDATADGTTATTSSQPEPDLPPLPPLHVAGRITQAGGVPIAKARVTLADQTGRQVGWATTELDGDYVIGVGNGGTFLLIIAADGVAPSATLVTVADGPARQDVTLAGTAWVSGRVTTSVDGTAYITPVAEVLVTLTDITGKVVGSRRTSKDGGYVFENLTPGPYVITVQSEAHRPLARTIDIGSSGATVCDLALPIGGHLAGTILDAADRTPVRHASITLTDDSGQVAATALTGADGAYRFDDLPAGPYVLTAAGYAPVARDVQVEEGRTAEQSILLGDAAAAGEAQLALDSVGVDR